MPARPLPAGTSALWATSSRHLVGFYHHRLRDELPLLVAMATRREPSRRQARVPAASPTTWPGMHEAVLEHREGGRILFPR